jgi:PPM family protein phosphatase
MAAHQFRFRGSVRTHVGQVREHNHDRVYLFVGTNFICGAVVDGMGDQFSGEQASQIVIDSLQTVLQFNPELESMDDDGIAQILVEALKTANLNIMDRTRGAGSTATMAFVRDATTIIAHIGVCRAYLINASRGSSSQLTLDHIVMMPLISAGPLIPDEPQDSTPKRVLYRALGQEQEIKVDIHREQLAIGDWLLLCTDGLYDHVNADEMATIVLTEKNPDSATLRLIDTANERGGEDNLSVVIIAIAPEREP